MELYHAKTWLGKYVFSQDAKVIAIQYAITAIGIGLVALVLSGIMRLQLGFPGSFSFIDPSNYLQFVTMHGMIMVIYLLTALFLGVRQLPHPLMVGARDMVFPYVNMISYWVYLWAVLLLVASFFVPGGPTGSGWTLYPPQAILPGTPGATWGIILMLVSLAFFIIGFTMGGLNYVVTILQAHTRDDADAPAVDDMGHFHGHRPGAVGDSGLVRQRHHDDPGRLAGNQFFHARHCLHGQTARSRRRQLILFQHLFWFSAIPRSTSSPCRRSASSPTCSVCMRGKTFSATG